MRACYNAFNEMFNCSEELTTNFIKKLQSVVAANVAGLNYDKKSCANEQRNNFRSKSLISFGMNMDNTTISGLDELFLKNNPDNFVSVALQNEGSIRLNSTVLTEIRDYCSKHKSFAKQDSSAVNDKLFLQKYCTSLNMEKFTKSIYSNTELTKLLDALGTAKDNEEAIEILNRNILNCTDEGLQFSFESYQPDKTNAVLESEMEKLITKYMNEIAKAHKNETKLEVIVDFIQSCFQLHPFLDTNCRTFPIFLLNNLLMKNGFPPAILEYPNKFVAYSKDELVSDVIKGMRNTLILAKDGKLFGYDSEKLINKLKSKPEFSDFAQTFNEATALENNHRTEKTHQNDMSHSESKLG